MKLTRAQREEVRMKFGGKCAYCGCELPSRWHADHVEPVWREWWKRRKKIVYDVVDGKIVGREEKQTVGLLAPENDTLDNLFPACPACNIDKHAMSLEGWRSVIANKVRVLRDNYKAFGHAERFGLVTVHEKPIVFWFERFTEEQCKSNHAVIQLSEPAENARDASLAAEDIGLQPVVVP